MTDEQIIAGLECLANEKQVLCASCEYRHFDGYTCHTANAKDAIALFQRQKNQISIFKKLLDKAEERIATARADAVREFADRAAALVKEKVAIIDELYCECDNDISNAYYSGKIELLHNLGWYIKEIVRELTEGE